MKKALVLFLSFLCAVTLLAGCGKKVSTDQIREDIRSSDYVYNDYGMTVTDYSETRYEGEQSKDKEIVFATVTAENDIFEYQCQYKLYYVLLSDGWQLQRCEDEILSVTPKVDLDLNQIRQDVQEYYREALAEYNLTEQSFGDVEVVNDQGSLNSFIPYRVYQVPFTGRNDQVQVDARLAIGYQLDHSKGWVISDGEFGFKGAKTEWSHTPVSTPDSAIARLMEEEGMESYEILSQKEATGTYNKTFYYEIRGTDTDCCLYGDMIYDFEVTCSFDNKEGWSAGVSYAGKTLTDAVPHVQGTWLYDDGTGLNRYEIYVERMDLDSISLSYDIIMTDYEGAETRHLTSDGIVTIPVNASRISDYSLKVSVSQNIAGPEGKGAGKYRLWFYNYVRDHEDFDESGFKLAGCILKKIS